MKDTHDGKGAKTMKEIQMFLEKISRSACLDQVNGDKCICYSCEAKRLLEVA